MSKGNGSKLASKIKLEVQKVMNKMQPNGSLLLTIWDNIIIEKYMGLADIERKISTTAQTQYHIKENEERIVCIFSTVI